MGVKYFLGWPPYGAVQMEVVNAHDGRQRRIGGVYIQFLFDMVVLDWRSFVRSIFDFILAPISSGRLASHYFRFHRKFYRLSQLREPHFHVPFFIFHFIFSSSEKCPRELVPGAHAL